MLTKPRDDNDFWADWAAQDLEKKWYKDVDYSYGNLNDYDVSGCCLEDSAWRECPAVASKWEHTEFHRVVFENVDLTEASFQHATGDHVTFRNCNLDLADFSTCQITDLRFIACKGKVYMDKAHLVSAKFHNSNLSGTDFSHSSLVLAEFTKCDLSLADFEYADIAFAEYEKCNLTDVRMALAKGMGGARTSTIFNNCIINPIADSEHDEFLKKLHNLIGPKISYSNSSGVINIGRSKPNSTVSLMAYMYCSDEVELEGEHQQA